MRRVPGFERPLLQWVFVALALTLAALTATEAIALRRLRRAIEELRAADLNARLDREQMERRLSREQSARESFVLEVERLRGSVSPTGAGTTLTLSPLRARDATPPDATVMAPAPAQSIQLRLLLPGGRHEPSTRFAVSVRSWSSGRSIWSRGELAPSVVDGKAAIVARVTGDVLAPGAYEIGVSEVTADGNGREVAFYEFAVGSAEPR